MAEKYGWGRSIVENLAGDLPKEFPGMRGLNSRNLWYIRNFFLHTKAT